MEIYYLKGIEKIGPLTLEELKQTQDITPDTLVWYEGLNEWKKLSDLKDIYSEIFSGSDIIQPPPIPQHIIDKETQFIQEKRKHENKKIRLETIKIVVSIVLGILSLCISYLIYYYKTNQSKNDLISKVELIFQGKTTVCDGVIYQINGTLNKLKKPEINSNDPNSIFLLNEYESKKKMGVVEEYTLLSGGFTVLEISKEDNGYVFKKTDAKNMIYKVGQYEYSYGYSMPTYRRSVEDCYSSALKYLTEERKDGSYMPNYYSKIESFPFLKSDYYELSNVLKPTFPNVSNWFQDDAGSVYTSQHAVFLKNDCKYYEIRTIRKETNRLILQVFLLGALIGASIILTFNFTLKYFIKD